MNSPLSVFVCGTYSDLSAERGAVLDALQQLQVEHHSMEFFGARSERPIETCLAEVRRSRVLVVIVGHRYGTLVPGLGISYSEAEYREAHRLGTRRIRLLIYLQGAVSTVDEWVESDSPKAELLESWKATLKERHTCAVFTDVNWLARQVAIDVGRAVREIDDEERASQPGPPEPAVSLTPSAMDTHFQVSAVSSQRFGDESRQLLTGLATDPSGNIVIAGTFWGTIDFGCSRLVSAGQNIFLATFSRAGGCVWSNRFGDGSEQVAAGVGIDSDGAVFLASSFVGTLNFGGSDLVSKGRYNVALAKLDRTGKHVWSHSFGDDRYHVAECIAVSSAGWIAIAGRFQGSIDFGGGVLESKSAQTDMFLAVFEGDGHLRWAKRFGGPHEQQTRSIAIDHEGNIGLTGVFKGSVSFDRETLTETSPQEYCGFLTKIDQFGNVTWCKRFGDPFVEQGSVVGFDRNNGDLLTAGFMRNKLPSDSTGNAQAICLFARYNPAGILRWSKAFGTNAIASDLSVGADGRILLTGYFAGEINLGLGPLVSAGGYDLFAAMFSPDGNAQWVRRYGDERHQFLIKGVQGFNREIVLAGSFHGTVDFGAGKLVASGYDGRTEGSEDIFLTILEEMPEPRISHTQFPSPPPEVGHSSVGVTREKLAGMESSMHSAQPPWYESNLLWVPISLGVGIILTVVSAMKHDLCWLLLLAWLCFGLGACAALRRTRYFLSGTISAAVVLAGALFLVKMWLCPSTAGSGAHIPESPSSSSPTGRNEQPSSQTSIGAAATQIAKTTSVPTTSKTPAKPSAPTSRPSRSESIINNAPGGIAISGGTVNSPTVNNNFAPAVKVTASAQTRRETGNPDAPWETRFTISTNVLVQTGDLRLKCSGPVIRAGVSRINPMSLATGSNGPDPKDQNEVVYELGPEMLSPGKVITIVVYSKNPVTVISGSIGRQEITF
jgi:Domain of unknown function (DUF4062)